MALNKFMHPRNLYLEKKPNFKALAVKYPEFRSHASQEASGKVTINFKDPNALRALSAVLLKDDFGLDVHIPADRLVPTIPLRLNYIHWIEDILKTTWNDQVKGIDIGTGASCIYPLLASRMNGWKFLASEQDEKSADFARSNVEQNGLQHLISVRKVEMDSGLKELLDGDGGSYDFCMCNPPFFGSQEEADGEFQREGRSEPHATPTASTMESITWGGEFCFVSRMIEDSIQLRDSVRVYSTMIGKKLNLAALKDELRNHKVPKISSTEFCQGKTMRWGLAWSFDPNLTFPKSHYKEKKKKARPPLALCIPMEIAIEFKTFCIHIIEILEELKINFVEVKQNNWILTLALIVTENTWSNQRRKRRQMLRESAKSNANPETDVANQMETSISGSSESGSVNPAEISNSKPQEIDSANQMETSISESSETGSANPAELSNLDPDLSISSQSSSSSTPNEKQTSCSDNSKRKHNNNHMVSDEVSRKLLETCQKSISSNTKQLTSSSRKHPRGDEDSEFMNGGHSPKKARIDPDADFVQNLVDDDKPKGSIKLSEVPMSFVDLTDDSPSPVPNKGHLQEKTVEETTPFLFKCNLSLRRNQTYVLIELTWLDGENRELMQQLFQFFRNKLLP